MSHSWQNNRYFCDLTEVHAEHIMFYYLDLAGIIGMLLDGICFFVSYKAVGLGTGRNKAY
jgi:hypothetical protein